MTKTRDEFVADTTRAAKRLLTEAIQRKMAILCALLDKLDQDAGNLTMREISDIAYETGMQFNIDVTPDRTTAEAAEGGGG